METILEWKVNNTIKKVRARLLLDSGCTGPILAQSFIKRNDIPVEVKKKRLHVVAANGIEVEGGTHNTKSLGVWMGKHLSKMKFESMGIREEGSCSKYRLLKGLAQDVDLLNFFSSVDVASNSQ